MLDLSHLRSQLPCNITITMLANSVVGKFTDDVSNFFFLLLTREKAKLNFWKFSSVNLKFIGHLTKFTDLDNFDFVDETVNIQNPNVENERITRTSRMNDMEEEPPF